MQEAIRVVRGAVSDKHIVPALRHLRIYQKDGGGRLQTCNGIYSIDVPFDSGGLDITAPAMKFITALELCDAPTLDVTARGRLSIKEASFKASLPLMDNTAYPLSTPDGDLYPVESNLLDAFSALRPFVGELKVWMRGIMLSKGNAYATNGFALLRASNVVHEDVTANIPAAAVSELLRIKAPIKALRVSENSCSFKLDNDAILKTATLATDWPDMDTLIKERTASSVHENLLDSLEKVMPFCDDKIPMVDTGQDGISAVGDGEANVSGIVLPDGRYHATLLHDILEFAAHLDLSFYPEACPFDDGADIDGVIIGMRK